MIKYPINTLKAYEFGRKHNYKSPPYIFLGEFVCEYKDLNGNKVKDLSIVEYGFGKTDKCSLTHIVPVLSIPIGGTIN